MINLKYNLLFDNFIIQKIIIKITQKLIYIKLILMFKFKIFI
jgi:hypothetical protein